MNLLPDSTIHVKNPCNPCTAPIALAAQRVAAGGEEEQEVGKTNPEVACTIKAKTDRRDLAKDWKMSKRGDFLPYLASDVVVS